MICPRCGKDNHNENKFCQGCGFDLADYRKKHSRGAGGVVRGLLIVILFVAIMFLCQSCVISGFSASLMMGSGFMGMGSAAASEDAMTDFLIGITDQIYENMVLILLISNLLTVLVVCLLFHLMKKKPVEEMYVRYVNPLRIPMFALLGMALNVFVPASPSWVRLCICWKRRTAAIVCSS